VLLRIVAERVASSAHPCELLGLGIADVDGDLAGGNLVDGGGATAAPARAPAHTHRVEFGLLAGGGVIQNDQIGVRVERNFLKSLLSKLPVNAGGDALIPERVFRGRSLSPGIGFEGREVEIGVVVNSYVLRVSGSAHGKRK